MAPDLWASLLRRTRDQGCTHGCLHGGIQGCTGGVNPPFFVISSVCLVSPRGQALFVRRHLSLRVSRRKRLCCLTARRGLLALPAFLAAWSAPSSLDPGVVSVGRCFRQLRVRARPWRRSAVDWRALLPLRSARCIGRKGGSLLPHWLQPRRPLSVRLFSCSPRSGDCAGPGRTKRPRRWAGPSRCGDHVDPVKVTLTVKAPPQLGMIAGTTITTDAWQLTARLCADPDEENRSRSNTGSTAESPAVWRTPVHPPKGRSRRHPTSY